MGGTLARQVGSRDLTRYEPQKGLKTVAAAEAAEKHFARAKDASKLQMAIRAKLEAQAEFVYWWDTQGPGTEHGGKRDRGKIADRKSWPSDLPSPLVVHRWRMRLNDPDVFERTYTAACAKYSAILEFEKTAHVEHNGGEHEWYSPAALVESARAVMGGIDLDPATSPAANEIVRAPEIFTAKDDGLAHRWHSRVWLNPPYAQPAITHFCDKLVEAVQVGTVTDATVLVNNATETQWFRTLADVSAAICFPTGRVTFWHPNKQSATPLQGQAVIYIGRNVEAFTEEFAQYGFVAIIRH